MQQPNPLAVVRAWQEAANRQDAERLVELSTPDVEVVGPRGSGHGHQLLRDWLGRAGLTLETRRAFTRGDAVVLAQHGVWRSAATGAVAD
ncbi:MAG TPA: nuclear transport factor 2 family protein, partial [Gemmataceae bacterium]|nr:nuclear transport factor 2 family protein [Gemmataceae bacterium]